MALFFLAGLFQLQALDLGDKNIFIRTRNDHALELATNSFSVFIVMVVFRLAVEFCLLVTIQER